MILQKYFKCQSGRLVLMLFHQNFTHGQKGQRDHAAIILLRFKLIDGLIEKLQGTVKVSSLFFSIGKQKMMSQRLLFDLFQNGHSIGCIPRQHERFAIIEEIGITELIIRLQKQGCIFFCGLIRFFLCFLYFLFSNQLACFSQQELGPAQPSGQFIISPGIGRIGSLGQGSDSRHDILIGILTQNTQQSVSCLFVRIFRPLGSFFEKVGIFTLTELNCHKKTTVTGKLGVHGECIINS